MEEHFSTTVWNLPNMSLVNSSAKFQLESDVSVITFTVLSTIFCLIAIIANFTTMMIVILLSKQTPFTKLFVNLAICDILGTLAIYVGDVGFRAGTHWNVAIDTCNMLFKIGGTCFSFFFFTSAVTLLVFALMRYIGITRPLSFKPLFESSIKVALYIALCWLISLCFTLPTILCDHAKQRCNISSVTSSNDCLPETALKFCTNWKYIWAGGKASILVIVVCLYLSLSRDLFNKAESFKSPNNQNGASARTKMNKHSFITILILLIILVFTGVPYITVKVFRSAHFNQTTIDVYNHFVAYFPYINFILDPIVYSIRSKDIHRIYKHIFQQMWSGKLCSEQVHGKKEKRQTTQVTIATDDMQTKSNTFKDSHVRITTKDSFTKSEYV